MCGPSYYDGHGINSLMHTKHPLANTRWTSKLARTNKGHKYIID